MTNPTREEVDLAWKALHMQPGEPNKKHRKELCRCDPDVGAVPCEYCALHQGLRCADALLDENELLKTRLENLSKLTKMLLDGYNPKHPLNQQQWESGVVFTAQKAVELADAVKRVSGEDDAE